MPATPLFATGKKLYCPEHERRAVVGLNRSGQIRLLATLIRRCALDDYDSRRGTQRAGADLDKRTILLIGMNAAHCLIHPDSKGARIPTDTGPFLLSARFSCAVYLR